jgi:predicted Fe-Mo cluster-binding NifX family protein
MQIVVTAEQPRLDSAVDSRFGRCGFFIFIDTETREWEAVDNRDAVRSSGAGIGAAQFVLSKGAKAVVTGFAGPKATQVLTAAGVEILSVTSGTVHQALENFKADGAQAFREADGGPSTSSFGRGQGRGGCGRGMGGGMGGGMGAGKGRGNR